MEENYPDWEPEPVPEILYEEQVSEDLFTGEPTNKQTSDLGFYKSIDNDYVRITFLIVAVTTSIFSLISFYLGYEFLTYWLLMANLWTIVS